jgi:hypothetical protein
MKKRQFTVLLIIWFFSQQLFAAVVMLSTDDTACASDTKSACVVQFSKHHRHNMPMIVVINDSSSAGAKVDNLNLDKEKKTPSNFSASCEHCRASCQPLVLTNHLVNPLNETHFMFGDQAIDAIFDSFLSSLFRPPILA